MDIADSVLDLIGDTPLVHLSRLGAADALVVVLLPDSGRGYLSKIFDDAWTGEYGFSTTDGTTVGDITRAAFAVVSPAMSVAQALAVLRDSGQSVAPVIKGQPPYSAAEVVGSIDVAVLAKLVTDPNLGGANVTAVMDPRLPRVGVGETLLQAAEVLASAPAAVVHDGGRPIALLTRDDLVDAESRE